MTNKKNHEDLLLKIYNNMEPDIQIEEYNDFYLITGKALFVASDFENDLKAFAAFLKIRTDPAILSNSKLLEVFFEKYKPAGRRIKEIGLNKNWVRLFDKAVNSRNYIAHELALAVYNQQPDEYSLNKFIEREVKPHVTNILIASSFIKSFFEEMNHEERPANWIESRKSWVCFY